MWLDAKESFAQMCEDSKMKDGLRGQMMQLDPLKSQKRLKEIGNENSKTALHKIAKKDDFVGTFIRAILSLYSTPLDNSSALQDFVIL